MLIYIYISYQLCVFTPREMLDFCFVLPIGFYMWEHIFASAIFDMKVNMKIFKCLVGVAVVEQYPVLVIMLNVKKHWHVMRYCTQ